MRGWKSRYDRIDYPSLMHLMPQDKAERER
jgi:hypothetical protein